MPYVDPNTVHTPTTGAVAPAAWGAVIRDDLEFLIDPPACSIFNSAAQSVADATNTVLTANSENFDNDTMHSTVSLTSRITIQTAGRYLFIASAEFATNTTGHRALHFFEDGTTALPPATTVQAVQTGATSTGLQVVRSLVLAVGQFIEVRAFQNSGGPLNVTLREVAAMFLTRA